MADLTPDDALRRVIEAAQRLGVELDEADALAWMSALAAEQPGGDVVHDERTGVFGHRVSMLDFSDADLQHFRSIGRLVEFADIPGVVETALALSGSAAQSKIQAYPGDADYFERVNIHATTREVACDLLADLIRQKALATMGGDDHMLREVKFGNYPADVVRGGEVRRHGTPIAWQPNEMRDGEIHTTLPDGQPLTIRWADVAHDPGWCKLDWVVADRVRGTLVNASNMLDVTWEAPDGTITPLDGFLDPYFQEIYLDATSVPIFAKLAQHVSGDALDDYVDGLEHEIAKYLGKDVNYGKAAKRMYNVFRLTGRYPEAAFIRELFDEPASLLYQVWALLRTMEECCLPGSQIPIRAVLDQADALTMSVVEQLDGDQEVTAVRHLMRLRRALEDQVPGQPLTTDVEVARAEMMNLVNNYFHDKLVAMPEIRGYMVEHGYRG
ncbi:MAG: hypothetical protein R2737_10745 [Candidatus Nanopelagicales bacterium]